MAWSNTSPGITGDLITAAQWNLHRMNEEWLARDHWRASMSAGTHPIPHNTVVKVNFATVNYNFGGLASVDTDVFTIPTFPTGITTALMGIGCHVDWASNSTGERRISLAGISPQTIRDIRTASNQSRSTIYGEKDMTSGQTVQVDVLQTSGASLDIVAATFTIRWLAWQN